MNILIADDELRLRKVVALFLRKNGHEVIEASSGEQALTLLKEHSVDVIILDVRMGGLSGIETAEAIRADSAFDSTPIILLTANVSNEDRDQGMQAGASAYITKPFSPKDLLEKVMELTGKS